MKKHRLTTTRIIMLGFLIGALIGAVCLSLPLSAREGVSVDFLDALFVAMSSICVTGLSTVNIGQTFSTFGQVVILLLIQFGGLGIVTFTTIVLILFRRRITLSDRMLIQSAYNLDTLSGLVRLTRQILKVTLCLEGIGAVGYCFVFIPEFGAAGIWYGIFHAVSAFCNAGIDLLGGNSFINYCQRSGLSCLLGDCGIYILPYKKESFRLPQNESPCQNCSDYYLISDHSRRCADAAF